MATSSADAEVHELVLERTSAASPDPLFRAWTEPESLQQWYTKPLVSQHGPSVAPKPRSGQVPGRFSASCRYSRIADPR